MGPVIVRRSIRVRKLIRITVRRVGRGSGRR